MHLKIISYLLVVLGVSVLVDAKCETGWAEFKEDCILFGHDRVTWDDAERRCRENGAWLMSDDNEEKHDFVRTILDVLTNWNYNRFFIGGSDYYFEGQFRWVETGSHVGPFTRWGSGQPEINNTRNCLMLTWEGEDVVWSDQQCRPRENTYYICEKQNNVTGPTVIG